MNGYSEMDMVVAERRIARFGSTLSGMKFSQIAGTTYGSYAIRVYCGRLQHTRRLVSLARRIGPRLCPTPVVLAASRKVRLESQRLISSLPKISPTCWIPAYLGGLLPTDDDCGQRTSTPVWITSLPGGAGWRRPDVLRCPVSQPRLPQCVCPRRAAS
jgi:hypothetical protein